MLQDDHNQLSIHGVPWEAILTFVPHLSLSPIDGKWFNDIPIVLFWSMRTITDQKTDAITDAAAATVRYLIYNTLGPGFSMKEG